MRRRNTRSSHAASAADGAMRQSRSHPRSCTPTAARRRKDGLKVTEDLPPQGWTGWRTGRSALHTGIRRAGSARLGEVGCLRLRRGTAEEPHQRGEQVRHGVRSPVRRAALDCVEARSRQQRSFPQQFEEVRRSQATSRRQRTGAGAAGARCLIAELDREQGDYPLDGPYISARDRRRAATCMAGCGDYRGRTEIECV